VAYYLGVDGGGSKTKCVIGDESSILAAAVAGPSNITRVGEVRAREALHAAMREACRTAKIDLEQLHRACVGAAGAGREEIASVVRRIVAEVVPGEIEVVGDMQIALQAALGGGPGVVVIAGTGSIAFGRDASGKTARAGGWGFAISDEGSAHWMGRAAVAAVLRSADESAEGRTIEQLPPLFREMKPIWKVESLEQLARAANSTPDFAALFPAVLAASREGDELAQTTLRQAATELAHLAGIVVQRLFPEQRCGAVPMAMAGGVFRHSAKIRELFYNQIRTAHPHVVLNSGVVEPVHGALQMARRSVS
jgi:N-acetylglucosamine kinase-like BadF-type ATPase